MNPLNLTQNLFDRVVEASPNAMVMIDSDGRIVLVNLQTEKLFGYDRNELLGQAVERLVPDRFQKSHPGLRKNFFHAPQTRAMGAGRELFGKRRDGSEVPIEIGLNPLEVEGRVYVLASIIDITERKRAEDRFRLAVEAAPNAMIMIDRDGKIIMANKQTERLFRYTRDQLLGKPVEALVPERFRAKHPGLREGFYLQPRVRSMGAGRELFGRTSDGEEVPIEIGLNPFEIEGQIHVLASIIDITERKKSEQLLSSREAALEASRIKSQFLATMSHEIRTPLNGIIGLTNLLHETELNEQQSELLKGVRISADTLLSLINDILDLSKIEANKMDFEVVNFNLENMIADTVSVVSSSAKQKGISIRVDIDPELPHWLKGDVAKIKQILTNLLGNAVKFTTEGSISLHVRVPAKDQKPSTVCFEVLDTGPGIDDSTKEKLFDLFTQGDSSTRRKFGGTGLGLSISKQLTLKMSGQIGVESKIGQGSLFWFHLPLETGEEVISSEIKSSRKPVLSRRDLRVLVAEDNIINQKVALGALNSLGLQGQAVGNGLEVLEILQKFSFDLILMDCHMPEMDGYEATQKIRADSSNRHQRVPIIAMTANVMQGDRERCLQVGMNDYLAKPIDHDEFVRVMERWTAAPADGSASESEIRDAVSKVRMHYGAEMARDVLKTYLELTPGSIRKVEEALAKSDFATVLRETHALKSTSQIVGCQSLAKQAAEAEAACRDRRYDELPPMISALAKTFSEARDFLQKELV